MSRIFVFLLTILLEMLIHSIRGLWLFVIFFFSISQIRQLLIRLINSSLLLNIWGLTSVISRPHSLEGITKGLVFLTENNVRKQMGDKKKLNFYWKSIMMEYPKINPVYDLPTIPQNTTATLFTIKINIFKIRVSLLC